MSSEGPILRVFEVRARPGCAAELLEKFRTTSAQVVLGEPGNQGYFFGQCVEGNGDDIMFVSVWESLDAVKNRFGADWQVSFMPDGYDELINECSVRHVNLAGGWHVAGVNAGV